VLRGFGGASLATLRPAYARVELQPATRYLAHLPRSSPAEREASATLFVFAPSVLGCQRHIDYQCSRRFGIMPRHDHDRPCFSGEAQISQPHFTGTGAHPAGLAPLARLRGSASHQGHRYRLHLSLEIRAHVPPARFPVSTCQASCPAFPRWRPRIHLNSTRLVVQSASSVLCLPRRSPWLAVAFAKAARRRPVLPPFRIAGRAPFRYSAKDATSHSVLPKFRVKRNFFV